MSVRRLQVPRNSIFVNSESQVNYSVKGRVIRTAIRVFAREFVVSERSYM